LASFRLSAHAEADLIAIYDHTDAMFGRYQADAYLSGLERIFALLAISRALDSPSTNAA